MRKSADRGYADHGWLKSFHSFSFADYHDPAHMGVGNLRVINEDRIAPGTGFGTHGHRDMEIVSYVLDGALAHKDSMGNGTAGGAHAGVIRPGDVQRMSAGTGVRHSEFNHAADADHAFPADLDPAQPCRHRAGLRAEAFRRRRPSAAGCALVASPDGRDGSVTIHADASIRAGLFDGAERAELALTPGRLAYVQVVRGSVSANGQPLKAGDAVTLDGETRLVLDAGDDAEVLVFDLAR